VRGGRERGIGRGSGGASEGPVGRHGGGGNAWKWAVRGVRRGRGKGFSYWGWFTEGRGVRVWCWGRGQEWGGRNVEGENMSRDREEREAEDVGLRTEKEGREEEIDFGRGGGEMSEVCGRGRGKRRGVKGGSRTGEGEGGRMEE